MAGTWLSFMTVGTLLEVVILRCNPKHVIAGDAHAVDNRFACDLTFAFEVRILAVLLGHTQILAHCYTCAPLGCLAAQKLFDARNDLADRHGAIEYSCGGVEPRIGQVLALNT